MLLQCETEKVSINIKKDNNVVFAEIFNNTLKDGTIEMNIVIKNKAGKFHSAAFVNKLIGAGETTRCKYSFGTCNNPDDFSVSATGSCIDSSGKIIDVYINE